MNIVTDQFIGLFRAMRAEKKEAINANATPSPMLGATMVKGLSLGEFEAPQYAGSYLLHAENASGRVATCSLVEKTKQGRNTFLANGKSLELRTGIPIPAEAPSRSNLKAWLAWVELVNWYHPAGIPVQVVEGNDSELSMRFPEQGDAKKKASYAKEDSSAIDEFIFGSKDVQDNEPEPESPIEF